MKKKEIYKGHIINLSVYEGLLPGRKKKTRREIVEHRGAAAILAFAPDGKIIMVKQDRFPRGPTLEIPAGTLEAGEEPLECAKRELEEETGYTAKNMRHLISFYPSIGYSTEVIHCYVAAKTVQLQDGQNLDDDEFITIQKMSLKRVLSMINTGKIQDSKTICAVLNYAARNRSSVK